MPAGTGMEIRAREGSEFHIWAVGCMAFSSVPHKCALPMHSRVGPDEGLCLQSSLSTHPIQTCLSHTPVSLAGEIKPSCFVHSCGKCELNALGITATGKKIPVDANFSACQRQDRQIQGTSREEGWFQGLTC